MKIFVIPKTIFLQRNVTDLGILIIYPNLTLPRIMCSVLSIHGKGKGRIQGEGKGAVPPP